MSQPNAWQTSRGGGGNRSSTSRTPQNRSNTGSPAQQNNPSQPPKQQPAPAGNVWTQRAAAAQQQQQQSTGNGPRSETGGLQEEPHTPVNGFNATEVKVFLGREAAPAVYRPQQDAQQGGQRNSGSAWGSKSNHMANGQPFFLQLAKQVAAFEGGG